MIIQDLLGFAYRSLERTYGPIGSYWGIAALGGSHGWHDQLWIRNCMNENDIELLFLLHALALFCVIGH